MGLTRCVGLVRAYSCNFKAPGGGVLAGPSEVYVTVRLPANESCQMPDIAVQSVALLLT